MVGGGELMRKAMVAVLLVQPAMIVAQPQHGGGESDRLAQIAALEAEGPSSFTAYLNALVQLSTSLANQGRYAEALPLLRRAHRASLQNLGAEHPTTEQLRVTAILMERFTPSPETAGRRDPAS
jgi:hypothetical protein